MTKQELLQRIRGILNAPSTRVVADNGIVKAYKMTSAGDVCVLVLYDNAVDFDGIKYDLEEGGDRDD